MKRWKSIFIFNVAVTSIIYNCAQPLQHDSGNIAVYDTIRITTTTFHHVYKETYYAIVSPNKEGGHDTGLSRIPLSQPRIVPIEKCPSEPKIFIIPPTEIPGSDDTIYITHPTSQGTVYHFVKNTITIGPPRDTLKTYSEISLDSILKFKPFFADKEILKDLLSTISAGDSICVQIKAMHIKEFPIQVEFLQTGARWITLFWTKRYPCRRDEPGIFFFCDQLCIKLAPPNDAKEDTISWSLVIRKNSEVCDTVHFQTRVVPQEL